MEGGSVDTNEAQRVHAGHSILDVTLGTHHFCWAPRSLHEMTKLPFGKLIFEGTITRSYESLPFSSAPRFVFYLFVFLVLPLLLISSPFLLVPSSRTPFASSSSLLLSVGSSIACPFGFIFSKVSYPFRMNVLFDSLLCIHVKLFHFWEIYCFVLNECVGLLCINDKSNFFFVEKNTHTEWWFVWSIQIVDPYEFFFYLIEQKTVNYFWNCFVV